MAERRTGSGGAGRITVPAFHGVVRGNTKATVDYSDPQHSAALGRFDQLAIEVVARRVRAVTGPVSLEVRIQHSADGLHWVYKNKAPEVSVPHQLSMTGETVMDIGYDDGAIPSLGLVRFKLFLSAAAGPIRALVTIRATVNDLQEKAFSAAAHAAHKGFDFSSYVVQYPPGSRVDASRVPKMIPYLLGHAFSGLVVGANGVVLTVELRDGLSIWFNAIGEYLLAKGETVLWSSEAYDEALIPPDGPVPMKPDHPKVKATLELLEIAAPVRVVP